MHIASIPTVYRLLVSTNSSAFASLHLGDGDLPVHPLSVWSLMVAVQYETLQDLSVYSLLTNKELNTLHVLWIITALQLCHNILIGIVHISFPVTESNEKPPTQVDVSVATYEQFELFRDGGIGLADPASSGPKFQNYNPQSLFMSSECICID